MGRWWDQEGVKISSKRGLQTKETESSTRKKKVYRTSVTTHHTRKKSYLKSYSLCRKPSSFTLLPEYCLQNKIPLKKRGT